MRAKEVIHNEGLYKEKLENEKGVLIIRESESKREKRLGQEKGRNPLRKRKSSSIQGKGGNSLIS